MLCARQYELSCENKVYRCTELTLSIVSCHAGDSHSAAQFCEGQAIDQSAKRQKAHQDKNKRVRLPSPLPGT